MNLNYIPIKIKKNSMGPKTFQTLKKLGINTVSDLINLFPRKYLDFNITELKDGEVFVSGTVFSDAKNTFIKNNMCYTSFDVSVNDKILKVTIFNRAFLSPKIKEGNTIFIDGKYDEASSKITATNLYFSILENTFEPIYEIEGIAS